MDVLVLVLLIVSAICFALAMMNMASRVNLMAAGLLAWVLVPLTLMISNM